MRVCFTSAISGPIFSLAGAWFFLSCPVAPVVLIGACDEQKNTASGTQKPLSLNEFHECAKGTGWREVYRPRPWETQRFLVFGDYSKAGFKPKENVVAVYNWSVLSSVELLPSTKKTVHNTYLNNDKTAYRFLSPDKVNFTINFSSHPATKREGLGSSIDVETKAAERKLVAVLQQTVAIYSSEHPFRLLKAGYTDAFAFSIYSRVDK